MPAENEAIAITTSVSETLKSDTVEETETISDEKAKLVPSKKPPYPKCIFFILGNEFCERYSYYGMRTILVLYLKYYMEMTEDTSTAVYHAFTVLAYLFPLMGAFIADSWLGKYRTILYLSIVYGIGMGINTLGAFPIIGNLTVHIALSMTGLFVIAVGTGGIKPCVASFGGDQFSTEQEQYRRRFFALFYFMINAGSLLSTILTPVLREDVHCMGRKDCYALAFGVPAALMVIAIITFVIGTPFYRIKPPEGNVLAEVFRGIKSAVTRRCRTPKSKRNKDHWMDYALEDTSAKLVRDTKYVLRVLILYIPLPFFWALFDQQGSRWTLQATRLNGYIGSVRIMPDQMQVLNPLFIVILIPLSEATLYPCLRKLNINFSPLRRMTLGMLLAGLSFVVAAFVQIRMNKTLTKIPELSSEASFRIINAADCRVQVSTDIYPNWTENKGSVWLSPGEGTQTLSTFVNPSKVGKTFSVKYSCPNITRSQNAAVHLGPKATWNMVISRNGANLRDDVFKGIIKKSSSGGAIIRVFNALNQDVKITGIRNINQTVKQNAISMKWDVVKQNYNIKVYSSKTERKIAQKSYYFDTGGVYTLLVWNGTIANSSSGQGTVDVRRFIDVSPNVVSLFWIIPQYFILTLGEIFLSVTGLEFSYTQAPTSMKSVLASFWFLTDSIGNIITIIIAEAKFVSNQAQEYFLFAGLIGLATILFVILAVRYEYVDESEILETENEPLALKPDILDGKVTVDEIALN